MRTGASPSTPRPSPTGTHRSASSTSASRSTAWVDRSWEIAHADGSGGVYTNFPDPDLIDWARAYHGGNHRRLARIKRDYDPDRLFDFPQCIEPDTQEDP